MRVGLGVRHDWLPCYATGVGLPRVRQVLNRHAAYARSKIASSACVILLRHALAGPEETCHGYA